MADERRIGICFVCTGNICRSPTAEVVFAALAEERGVLAHFTIDSAGTHGYHAGEQADPRTRRAAAERGYRITHRARAVTDDDFARFDYLIALDASHERALLRRKQRLEGAQAEIALLRGFVPGAEARDVADPYYGEETGFFEVLDQCEEACAALLDELLAIRAR